MGQSYISIWFHLVWSTKNREPFIQNSWKMELYAHIKEYCQQKEYHLDFINGMPDHIHLLISPKATFAISDIVRNIKTDSYYWIKENKYSTEAFGWQDGYGVFSVSPSQVQKVRNYIKNQEIHHQKHDFNDEIKWFESLK
jgi:putative transposase